jgi:hypothetical protein
VDSEVAKLERIAHAHATEQRRLAKTIASAPSAIEHLQRDISKIEHALELRADIAGDAFKATITGVTCEKRSDAGERIRDALVDARHRFGETIEIGNLAGLDLVIAVKGELAETELHLLFPDAPVRPTVIATTDIDHEHPVGLVSRLTNRLGDLEERLSNDARELEVIVANVDQAQQMMGKAFDQAGRLVNLRARQAEITEALMPNAETDVSPEAAGSPTSEDEAPIDRHADIDVEGVDIALSTFPSEIPQTHIRVESVAVQGQCSSLDLDLALELELDTELAHDLSMSNFDR